MEFSYYAALRDPLAEVSQCLWIAVFVVEPTGEIRRQGLRRRKSLSRDAHDEAFYLRPLTYEVQIVGEAFWLGGVCDVVASGLDAI